jgi:DNA-directed RNA polymerase specialized sigma24 family protein
MRDLETQDFLEILRSGDQESAEKLIASIEPWIRRVIHSRLVDRRLRRLIDTADVFQSLMGDFFARPQSEPSTCCGSMPADRYLSAAVHKKILMRLRKERRHSGDLEQHPEPLSREPSAGQCAAEKDYLDAVRNQLRNENRRSMDLRLDGFTWKEISAKLGGPSDTLRIRLRRSVAVAICELNRRGIVRNE